MSRPALLTAFLLAAVFAPVPLAAQGHHEVVTAQLDATNTIMVAEGYARDVLAVSSGVQVGLMPAGAVIYLAIELEEGSSYLINGVCDYDCADLDLYLLDAEGDVVAEDIDVDDVPLLDFVAPAGRAFLLGVSMATCSDDYCFFGYQILKSAKVVQ